jgi:hypothetical protein
VSHYRYDVVKFESLVDGGEVVETVGTGRADMKAEIDLRV